MLDLIIKILILIIAIIVFIALGLPSIVSAVLKSFFICIFTYFEALKFSMGNISVKEINDHNEPAKEKYFFHKQYRDLKNTWFSVDGVNRGKVLLMKKKMYDKGRVNFKKLKAFEISIYIFGNIFRVIYTFVHFLIVTIISIPNYIFYYIIKTLKGAKRARGKLSNVCPHCYDKFQLPHYVCVKCGRVHKKLIPGPYGIVRRKCVCGETIPCAFYSRTDKIKAICPTCSKEVEIRESTPICISVVGPKASGKTSFILSAINLLLNNISREKKWDAKLLKENLKEDGKIYNVFINSKKFSSEKLLYIYDILGEKFNDKDSIKKQKYYRYIDGLIFIIDPNVDMYEINDLLDRFIIALREIRQIKLDKFIPIPIAVVVNKIEELDNNTENLLNEMGGEAVIRKINYNFTSYKFFACNNMANISKEKTYGVEYGSEPVKWILSEANRELK
ncbi:MAG: GTPase domain-containing protein [Clostridiaceae bacterium]